MDKEFLESLMEMPEAVVEAILAQHGKAVEALEGKYRAAMLDGAVGKAGILNSPCGIGDFGAKTKLGMEQHGGIFVGFIKAVAQVAEENKGELKTLASVNAHYAHVVSVVAPLGFLVAFCHTAQPCDKAEKPAIARFLEGAGQLEKGHEIGAALLSACHGGAYRKKLRLGVNAP